MKAGDRVYRKGYGVNTSSGTVRSILDESTILVRWDSGKSTGVPWDALSLIDDNPNALPFTTASEYFAEIKDELDEIDKLYRGLSND